MSSFILFYTLTSVTTVSDPYRMGTSYVTLVTVYPYCALLGGVFAFPGVLATAGPAATFSPRLIRRTH
jgi:hypothetical protein